MAWEHAAARCSASPLGFLPLPSNLMMDKITTMSKDKIGERIGRLDDADIVRLNQAGRRPPSAVLPQQRPNRRLEADQGLRRAGVTSPWLGMPKLD